MKNRRAFIKKILLTAAGGAIAPVILYSQPKQKLNKDLVFEFVKAGHNDFHKVKEMLADEPGLINSSWDWGNGDFETAIGGAGHVGNKEIAECLIDHGARVNLFTLAMLGENDLVISTLDKYPSLIFSKGPHGFTLLHHAIVGGDGALKIKNYLNSKGLERSKI